MQNRTWKEWQQATGGGSVKQWAFTGKVQGQAQHVLTHGRNILKRDAGNRQACILELACLSTHGFKGDTFGTGKEKHLQNTRAAYARKPRQTGRGS